ncbi:MAG: FAD-binding oxidoreductase [Roseibium sp.]
MSQHSIGSWGGLTVTEPDVLAPDDFASSPLSENKALPFGNGRSYGDSCLNAAGHTILAQSNNRILSFDPETGKLEAEAGVLLSEIIAHVAPHGWFPAVVPGTQFVTLGGAIANDIHGKNHHKRGTFGCHVLDIHLDRSDAPNCPQKLEQNTELFDATIGGMGLTGLIRTATIQLMPIDASQISQVTTRFENLETYFELAAAADERHEYAVAWIDSLSKGKQFGRGHLIAGDHAEAGTFPQSRAKAAISVPFKPFITPLQGPFLRLFNEIYFRGAPAGTSTKTEQFDKFFFPLDRLGHWNRLYGPRGLHQHQSVLPEAGGFEAVKSLLECTHISGQGSFLTVLKRFGAIPSPGFMSFPRPGYTLTLDFPDKGKVTLDLLQKLDDITLSMGGAINPYKDRRMTPETFAASFPQWRKLEALRDPALCSDFWTRTALKLI